MPEVLVEPVGSDHPEAAPPPVSATSKAPGGSGGLIRAFRGAQGGLVVLTLVLGIIFGLVEPRFATGANLSNIATQVPALIILAVGESYAILVGGIDLSAGAMTGLISVLAARAALSMGTPVAFAVAAVSGAVLGAANGAVITKLRIPPVIQTIAMLSFSQGLSLWLTGAVPVQDLPPGFEVIGSGFFGPIPIAILVALALLLLNHLLLQYSRFGRYVYAVGGNPEAAYTSGIDVDRVKLIAYMLVGLNVGIASFVLTSRVNTGVPTLGSSMELEAIAAAVIGGVSIGGGVGRLGGVFLGALLLAMVRNGLNLVNVSTYSQMMVIGLIIVAAVIFDLTRQGKARAVFGK